MVQVQFNLQLSEKERVDKEKVVLPFEHQGELDITFDVKLENLSSLTSEIVDKHFLILFCSSGNGKSIDIYDGRRSLLEGKIEATPLSSGELQTDMVSSGKGGEIIYFRDSDDENPDSDEDPDDDLDI